MDVALSQPTQEQMARFAYIEERPVERGQTARVIRLRRVPWVASLLDRGQITEAQARALLWYRDRYDAAQVSPLRDSLDREPVGGGGDPDLFTRRLADAASDVRFAERGVPGALLWTLRAMALDDWTATEVARQRWGLDPARDVASHRIARVMLDFKAAAAALLAQVGHIADRKARNAGA